MIDAVEKVARKAILQAGTLIREKMGRVSSADIQTKGPSDYVTQVDQESEALIKTIIRANFRDHSIIAEESTNAQMSDGITWIIDPLDGTTNFIHGFPFVAVSIAVCMNQQAVLGMVLDPIREELFSALRGRGAFLNDQSVRMREPSDLGGALIATGFPFRARHLLDPYLNTFRQVFQRVSGIRRAGSAALDLAYVAAGRVDGFWEAGLKSWDIAAGSLIILEAGGTVSDFWGSGNYLRNGHIVAGTNSVHSFLLQQVKEHLAPSLETAAEDLQQN
jgi:myo-inositol-1(or 4)-monophosphatase